MSTIGPIDDDPTPHEAQAGRERDPDDELRLKRREQNRRYRENHPEQNAATRRKWVDANRDRVRGYNRKWRSDNLERARELNHESARRAVLRARKQADIRASAKERAMWWRQSHLDQVRIYQAQWVEQNRQKVRGYYNDYYRTHRNEVNERAAARRDADPEPLKRARAAWAERNKERLAELQRNRRSNPEVYQAQLEANAAARRLKRRLRAAGLPPKQLHPTTAAERRANERAVADYFGDSGLAEHVRQTDIFTETLTNHLLQNGAQMRAFAESYAAARWRTGLPAVAVEDTIYARAVEYVLENLSGMDLLTSRDIAAAVRSSKATVQRVERDHQREALVDVVVGCVNRHRDRLNEDAEIENRARVRHDRPRVPADDLRVRLAFREMATRVPTDRLTIVDVRRAFHAVKLRTLGLDELTMAAGYPSRLQLPSRAAKLGLEAAAGSNAPDREIGL
jgi:hypothetical protein